MQLQLMATCMVRGYGTNYHILPKAAGTPGGELPSFEEHRHDQKPALKILN